jgi:hypothetical protein
VSVLLVPETPIEQIARDAPPQIMLSKKERDRIAHLALLISQQENRKAGDLTAQPDYTERPEAYREASRLTVVRVIQAMTMLGYLEKPD